MIATTLTQTFIENARKRGKVPFLFYKREGRWLEVSWNEVAERVKYLSLGLISIGVEKGDRIAPISNTNPDMVYCCLAIAMSGAIFAPIYHTNSAKECVHVINDSGSTMVFAEDQTQLDKLKVAWMDCPQLKKIIVFKLETQEKDSRIMALDQLMELGKEVFERSGDKAYYKRLESVKSEDVTAIVYTSGTTGAPKGVMLTNGGIIKALMEQTKLLPVPKRARGISVLPMAHLLELMNGHWYHVLYGFPQIYAESIRTLYNDVREMKPTFFFTAPRFYEKIYNEMMAYIQASPAWKKKLISWCLTVGERYQDNKGDPNRGISGLMMRLLNSIAHLVFFRRVHATVGGKMEWSSTGSAPIPSKILLFFRACDFPIYEGYGLTESAGLVAMNRPNRVRVGTVGIPPDGTEVRIAEDGEILVKGWNRCAGYWNKPEAMAELFADGWLHTGDQGFLDEDGFLHINGRKKEVLITSTGKTISPSNIQVLLKTIPYIAEAVVFGEGRTYLTAIITLDEESVTRYAREHDIPYQDFASLTKYPAIIELVEKEIAVKNQELAAIEQIKKFTILNDQFRQDREEVGPTMKVKRMVVENRYKDKIEAMYAN